MTGKNERIKTFLAGSLVCLAFGPSLEHIHQAVTDYGQTGWVAWAIALSVDGLAAYVGLILRDRHRAGDRRWDAIAILLVTVAATVSAQVVTAQWTVGGVIVAVWPAVAFLALLALIELNPERKVNRSAGRGKAKPSAQVKPQATAPLTPSDGPGPDRVQLHSVTRPVDPDADPNAPVLLPGEGRGQAVARWVTEGHPHGVMVKAAMDLFDVGQTTAKNAVRDARRSVAS